MMMYLLLRDNKQSGPYSLDELKTLGLKAYDLVWVDGKSAAWRYPSELEELRPFAPVVEEQPFDRFYKKAMPAKSAGQATPVVSRTGAENETYAGEPSAVPGKRIIYVTMPAGKGTVPIRRSVDPRPVAPAENITRSVYQPVPSGETGPIPPRETGSSPFRETAPTSPREAALATSPEMYRAPEEKLSHVQDDWKSAVEITPPIRKRNTSRIGQLVAVAVCILALLAAGIFIGLSINKDAFGLGKKIASRNVLTDKGQGTNPVSQQQPVAAGTTPASALHAESSINDSLQAQALLAEKRVTTTGTTIAGLGKSQPPRQSPPREKLMGGSPRNQAATPVSNQDSVSMGIPVVHREAVHRADLPADKNGEADKDVIKNNITNLVSVGTNGYTVGTFGGITDLQLTVSNRSVYPLDLVVVEVQYIQANKKVFKTENLYFRGIGAGAALMQEAPKSTRGIKVQYKITLVNSKELGLSYSGI
jgi:hypothetical protein